MTEYRQGDKVRLTREFTIQHDDDGSGVLYTEHGCYREQYWEVELVERRKPKVGDVIKTRAELADLPNRSVVVNDAGNPLIIDLPRGGCHGFYGRFSAFSSSNGVPPYRVIHIPE